MIGKLLLLQRYQEAVDVILLDDYCDDDEDGEDDGADDEDGNNNHHLPCAAPPTTLTPLQRARQLYRQGAPVATVLQVTPLYSALLYYPL